MALFVVLLTGGCDTASFAAESTAGVFARGGPAFEEYWDYDLAGEAVPATIVQLEGMLRIVPDNEVLLAQLARAYVGYAYGWVEVEVEAYEFEGEYDKANEVRRRGRTMYLRAKDLTQHWVRLEHPGIDDAIRADIEGLEGWLQSSFAEPGDAEMLFWLGYSWGSYINLAKDDMEAIADLAYAKAFVQRSIELDPNYYHAGGYTFMGVATASEMAADLDQAKAYFEQALDRTERRALVTHVNMARHYAVKAGNRELFDELLAEVMEAGDVLPEARLANRMARERAALYIENADQLF